MTHKLNMKYSCTAQVNEIKIKIDGQLINIFIQNTSFN